MCGISCYIGPKNASQTAVEGLKRLEYRGYDSYGIAFINGGINTIKRVGKISDFHGKLESSGAAIAHTRWATHGAVTVKNSHPHCDCKGSVAVIHNGIIENYQEIKSSLISKGHKFISETDTETLAHLIEECQKKTDFRHACMKAFSQCEGSNAFVALGVNGEIAAYRDNSPLVLGLGGEGEYFLASDATAFLEFTRNVIFLHDKDFVHLSRAGYEIRADGKQASRDVSKIEWSLEQARKGNYEHYMLKEITEQSETVAHALSHEREKIESVARKINDAQGVFFVSCGSSYHACLQASYAFSGIAKKHINVSIASEFSNYSDFITPKTLVIAVSQSGETADVLDAVKAAKLKGARTLAIVNVTGSSLTRYCDDFLSINAGPEICVLSTKTYTAQLMLLDMLAYACAGMYEEGKKELCAAPAIIKRLTEKPAIEKAKRLAQTLKGSKSIFTMGRGMAYPSALEAALKIKEVSYVHAEGFAGGELKHGTIAMIESGTPCIVFVDAKTEMQTISNAMEVKSRGGFIIGVSSKNNEAFDFWIEVPDGKAATSACQIIPIQLLSYQLALLKGLDPDRPRNLAKAVTVK